MVFVHLIWQLVICFFPFVFADKALKRCPYWRPAANFHPFFFSRLNFVPLGCCERPERYQRPPALHSPSQIFPPQLRLDFISNPLCIWKARLPESSDSQRLWAVIVKLSRKKIYLWTRCLMRRTAPHRILHEHTKISSAHLRRDSFCGICCENFWNDAKHVTPVASSAVANFMEPLLKKTFHS